MWHYVALCYIISPMHCTVIQLYAIFTCRLSRATAKAFHLLRWCQVHCTERKMRKGRGLCGPCGIVWRVLHNLVTPRHRHSQKLWASQSFVDSALKSEHIEWGLLPGHALDVTPCDSNSNHLPLCHFTSKGIQNRGEAQRMQEWRRMRKNEEERWNVIAITRLLR